VVDSYLLEREIKRESLPACYFFFGEETYLAEEFLQELKKVMTADEEKGVSLQVEKFNLSETRWADIIDLARTVPFFFAPRRLLVVEGDAEKLTELSPGEESILKDYFRSPLSGTVLAVILAGKAKKSHAVVRFFLKFPSSAVASAELKPLKEEKLYAWIDRKLEAKGKRATFEAKKRLIEVVGSDLRRMANELEKVTNFVDDKKDIEIEDIHQVCGWVKPGIGWELTNSLERADVKQSLLVLNQLFRDGAKEEMVVGIIANFFRDVLAAKVWLKEKRDKKEIFARLRPFIQSTFSNYPEKLREFFARVESFSWEELGKIFEELAKIDALVKTSDSWIQPRLETFLLDCLTRKGKKRVGTDLTWAGGS